MSRSLLPILRVVQLLGAEWLWGVGSVEELLYNNWFEWNMLFVLPWRVFVFVFFWFSRLRHWGSVLSAGGSIYDSCEGGLEFVEHIRTKVDEVHVATRDGMAAHARLEGALSDSKSRLFMSADKAAMTPVGFEFMQLAPDWMACDVVANTRKAIVYVWLHIITASMCCGRA